MLKKGIDGLFLFFELRKCSILFVILSKDISFIRKIFVLGLIIFTVSYLVFGELRTKYINVELNKNEIIVKRFFGLKAERYRVSDIEGWKYSLLPSRGGTYEYLYLYKNNKKQIKISEFYHKNYKQLKSEIQAQYKSLGYEKFSYLDELKEIFI